MTLRHFTAALAAQVSEEMEEGARKHTVASAQEPQNVTHCVPLDKASPELSQTQEEEM